MSFVHQQLIFQVIMWHYWTEVFSRNYILDKSAGLSDFKTIRLFRGIQCVVFGFDEFWWRPGLFFSIVTTKQLLLCHLALKTTGTVKVNLLIQLLQGLGHKASLIKCWTMTSRGFKNRVKIVEHKCEVVLVIMRINLVLEGGQVLVLVPVLVPVLVHGSMVRSSWVSCRLHLFTEGLKLLLLQLCHNLV